MSDSRARADAGIQDCVDLMVTGQWVRGLSHKVIAEKYGIAETTARDWATNASRIVRGAIEGDREEIRARMMATLDSVISLHLAKEPRAAVAAIELQAKLLGLLTHHVQVSGSLEQMARGDDADRLRVAKSVVAALESARKGNN